MAALVPRFFSDITEWFESERPGHMIRVEDKITDHEYVVRAELPGMDPEKDIKIDVDNGMLSIHAERHEETNLPGRSEFRYGVLERAVRLPSNADDEHIKALYDKGILEVTVPLKETQPAGRQIQVTSR